MRIQRTTRHLLSITLCTLALGSPAWAGGGFRDDFSDGSIQDGSPVTWQWDPQRGQCAVSPQGLQLSPAVLAWSPLDLTPTDRYGRDVQYSGNITVKAQFNLGSEPTSNAYVGLVTPDHQPGSLGGYTLSFNRSWFFLSRDGAYRADWHWSTQGLFDAAEDIIIQLDLIYITDDAGRRTARLECRWWVAGQAMPAQPQIVGVDSVYDVSGVALGAFTFSIEGSRVNPVIFRWVEVIGCELEPIVDLNGDGTVDINDLLRLIESWGQDDPAVDVVLDGVVDKKDLEVLMNYWHQDVNDPTLLAHWALDETDGELAPDSTGLHHDATLVGSPAWDPNGGRIGGALQLDGINDYVTAPFILNPYSGPFSVFAWIKSDAPGKVILSQKSGANWLLTDSSGNLMTELKALVGAQALTSQTVITDGQWHRVGLSWDGTHRILYVDGEEVKRDTQVSLASSNNGLYLGAGKGLESSKYWSGLIDDVRIYNRAVRP